MAITFVASVSAGDGTVGAGSGTTGTSAAIDTTGATLLVMWVTRGDPASAPVPTDSKSNTWTPLTDHSNGAAMAGRLFYVANPTVGSGHTFSAAGGGSFPAMVAMAFAGVATSTPFDQQNGAATAVSGTLATGSVTPTQDNELVVTGLANHVDDGASISGGFSTPVYIVTGASNEAAGMAYLIQTTATAANPTWGFGGTTAATGIATFKAAGGAAAPKRLLLMGIGDAGFAALLPLWPAWWRWHRMARRRRITSRLSVGAEPTRMSGLTATSVISERNRRRTQ